MMGPAGRTPALPVTSSIPDLLLGRQRELAHIEELLSAAKEGTSAALLVHGEPGIGSAYSADS